MMKVEKHVALGNFRSALPYDLIPDEEVKRKMETQIAELYPSYHIIEWGAIEDVHIGFGRRVITCKLEVDE